MIFALYDDRKLGYVKYGDENWTLLDDLDFGYDDIIVYKGKPYVIDDLGMVSWIDSSNEADKIFVSTFRFGRPEAFGGVMWRALRC